MCLEAEEETRAAQRQAETAILQGLLSHSNPTKSHTFYSLQIRRT